MKNCKRHCKKISLILMMVALAFVALPSNYVFAENESVSKHIYISSRRNLDGVTPPPMICPPKDNRIFNFKKQIIDSEDSNEEFPFYIKAQASYDGSSFVNLDLSNDFLTLEDDGVFSFSLKNDEVVKVEISDDCQGFPFHFRIWEGEKDGWELVGIDNNDNTNWLNEENVQTSWSDEEPPLYTFTNRKITEETIPLDENIVEDQVGETFDNESELSVPNTGENTGGFSATRTGIVAFAVVVTVGRVAHLIRKYQKDGRK